MAKTSGYWKYSKFYKKGYKLGKKKGIKSGAMGLIGDITLPSITTTSPYWRGFNAGLHEKVRIEKALIKKYEKKIKQ